MVEYGGTVPTNYHSGVQYWYCAQRYWSVILDNLLTFTFILGTGPPLTELDFRNGREQRQSTTVPFMQMQLALEEGEAVFSARKAEWQNTLKISHSDLRYYHPTALTKHYEHLCQVSLAQWYRALHN